MKNDATNERMRGPEGKQGVNEGEKRGNQKWIKERCLGRDTESENIMKRIYDAVILVRDNEGNSVGKWPNST